MRKDLDVLTIESDTNALVSQQKRTESEKHDAKGSMIVPPRALVGQTHDDILWHPIPGCPSQIRSRVANRTIHGGGISNKQQ
jgi:hypothetical protein